MALPAISFEKNNINFGLVDKAEGEKRFEFRFVNSGNAPLVLTYVHASCSCVRLEYPRQPIAPGDSSFIAGRLNPATIHETDFKRSILVRTNANPPQTRLFITGKIKSVESEKTK
ncbi:DUF1573 domain-containing protein [uncultured Duncaniella sp.]|uniref:DUF1573 domain-containing protein n=1 Tax=uncultured Duncaniella sp. TaxID=2768039 RepID=UPI0025A556D3|nr:DUF1573 domain-containing protein [uncultured Duncaniella sp.]